MSKPKVDIEIGEDLYGISIEELEKRIIIMNDEISRLNDELSKKRAKRLAADDLFKKST